MFVCGQPETHGYHTSRGRFSEGGLPLHPKNCCHFQAERTNSTFKKAVFCGAQGLLCHKGRQATLCYLHNVQPGIVRMKLLPAATYRGPKWAPISKRWSNPVQPVKRSSNPHRHIPLGSGSTLIVSCPFGVKCSSLLSALTRNG